MDMEDCREMKKPDPKDEDYVEKMEDWRECQEENAEIDREARQLEREAKKIKLAELDEKIKEVQQTDRYRKRLEQEMDRKANRMGLFVLVGLVALVFWFLYHFILEKDDTTFYILVAAFFVTVFYIYGQLFAKHGPQGGQFKFL